MAEALARYRKAGVLLADLPRLDFGDRRESARSSALLDERLGQLSQWALGEAADRAKDEGLQFGADNPVTMQQLRAAEDIGRSPNELLQPRHTVFGEAARSMQIAALASDVEIDGQETINRLKLAAKHGEIDAPTAATELRALVDGTGKSLAKIDPKASHKVRASLSTSAMAAYSSILDGALKKQDEQVRVAIDDWISNTAPEQVRSQLAMGDTIDPETGKVITPQQRIVATLHSPLREKLRGQSDEFARQADKRFGDMVARERVNTLSAHALENNLSLAQIRGGQLGKYTGTWREMQADDQEKVVINFMQESGRRHLVEDRTRKQGEDAAKREVYDLLSGYWTMRDGPKKDALKREIVAKGQGALSFDQLKSLLKPAGDGEAKEDPSIEGYAQDLIRRGGVTDLAELQRRVPKLKPKQMERMRDMLHNAGDREVNQAVRTLAGIPDGLVAFSGDQARRMQALQADLAEAKRKEIAEKGTWSPSSVIAGLGTSKRLAAVKKETEGARASLESYAKGKKGAVITESTSEQELKALKFTPQQISEIQRHQRAIKGDQ